MRTPLRIRGVHLFRPSGKRTTGAGAQDAGRPYQFVSAVQLLEDFFDEVERILEELGVAFEIVADREEDQ